MSLERASPVMSLRTVMRTPFLMAVTAVLLLICGRGAAAGTSEAARRSVEPVIADVLDAWGRSDARAIAAQYETNGDFVSPDGMHAEGRRQIEAFYQGAFARGYSGSHATGRVIHVRNLSGTVALVDGSWTIEVTPAARIRRREAGLFFAVLRRHDGRWWIAALREQSSGTKLRELSALSH